MKLVSVIMPAYNAGTYINQAIDSVLNQTYTNFELLISDDPSKDNTRKIIDTYKDNRIRIFHNDIRLGFIDTLNMLLSNTKGDYITKQDADDYSHPQRVEILLNEFENDKELGACGSNYNRVDPKGKLSYTSDFALNHNEIILKIPDVFDLIGSGLMIKRKVYEEIGGYNNFFHGMGAEDFYWSYLITEKFKIKNVKQALYNYRNSFNSISGDLSDNPKKMISFSLVSFLIRQRMETGTDLLEKKEYGLLDGKMNELLIPYNSDKSYLYKSLAKRYFWESKMMLHMKWKKNVARKLQFKAFIKKPNSSNLRDLLYYLRK